jgi:hypothetical protein
VRLGAKNALSAKMRPRRATCGLRIRDGSKIISGSRNVFLASILVALLARIKEEGRLGIRKGPR